MAEKAEQANLLLIKEKQEQLAAEQALAAAKAAGQESEKIRLLEEALEKEKLEA